jgi:hypothetical protein
MNSVLIKENIISKVDDIEDWKLLEIENILNSNH